MTAEAVTLRAIAGRMARASIGHRRIQLAKLCFDLEAGIPTSQIKKIVLKLAEAPTGKRSKTTDDERQLSLF